MAGGRLLPVLLGALEEMKDSAIKNTSEKKKEEGENSAFPHLIERAEVGKALKFRFADRTEGGGGKDGAYGTLQGHTEHWVWVLGGSTAQAVGTDVPQGQVELAPEESSAGSGHAGPFQRRVQRDKH